MAGISSALEVLENALQSGDNNFDDTAKRRLLALIHIQDPVGTLPTPRGPLVACPFCRHPLTLGPHEAHSVDAKVDSPARVAYVTLLYGGSVAYLLGALVVGQNLARHSAIDRVLMYTFDVPQMFLDLLSTYWTLRKVDYLIASKWLFYDYEGSRFHNVFTKLRVLSLADYSKVLMLDIDMLIRTNVDDLFSLNAPGAMKRHGGSTQPAHGEPILANQIWRGPWASGGSQNIGINAGVMLLEPNEEMHKRMCDEVWINHVEHVGTYGPEQDYLSRFYTTFGDGAIRHIACEYNYQPKLPEDYTSPHYKSLKKEDIKICHYSGGAAKPWYLDVETILQNDDAIKQTYSLSDPNSGTILSDLTWEWVFAAREAARDIERNTGKKLQEHVNEYKLVVEEELQRMNARESLSPEDQRELETILGEWVPARWSTYANNRNGWLEFRPHNILWTDKGVTHWQLEQGNINGAPCMFLGGQLNASVKLVPPAEHEKAAKKFAGVRIQGWPVEKNDGAN
eukprot:GEMP01034267.1.p1 GENE.GEMP01034267.1~~GEMP01034267.1.p1  ORF type:complete len:510 (+),score=103.51 GEMP01034267.1:20-1549(+)